MVDDIRKCQEWAFAYTNKLAQCLVHLSGQNSVAKISYLYDNKTSSLNHWLGVVDKWPIDFRGLES